ncbi:toxin-antitoxin system YwqK family antitoxin [uncultured Polaribacter sp.]|uniref:toxin-antitoxin system YwqK family antitoxin n=1 Tax=uncultured Polaribacter sp. TaxID=174711 RepID=UPI002605F2F3|nr:toxin-antitoxin system YwqK family antitoxin [uncultured Polaribacter sp.]
MIHIKKVTFLFSFFVCFFVAQKIDAQNINRYDKNKQRTGVWKKYHPNKRIRYTGQFKEGKEIGVFKFYDITSSEHPVAIKTFFDNSDSLFVQFFTLKGQIKTEGILNKRSRVGNWKYFYPDGTLMSEENYNENGKLHGNHLVYYPDGKITSFSTYENGLLEDIASKFSSDGVLIEEITYHKGVPHGLAKYFELNGNLKESGNYNNGKRVGKWNFYLDGEEASDTEVLKSKTSYNRKKNEQ